QPRVYPSAIAGRLPTTGGVLLAPQTPNTGRRGQKPGSKPGPKRTAAASTRSGKRRGEIRTSRGQRACRARKPRKSGELRTERGEVGTGAESRNDPQEPNLTRESGNGSRSRPRGIAHRERPRLSTLRVARFKTASSAPRPLHLLRRKLSSSK